MKLPRPNDVLKTIMLGASALSVAAAKAPATHTQDSPQCSSGLTIDIQRTAIFPNHPFTTFYYKGQLQTSGFKDHVSATVGYVIPGSPAAKANLESGEEIQTIGSEPVSKMSFKKALDKAEYAKSINRYSPLSLGVDFDNRFIKLECPKPTAHSTKLHTRGHQ